MRFNCYSKFRINDLVHFQIFSRTEWVQPEDQEYGVKKSDGNFSGIVGDLYTNVWLFLADF